MGMPCELSDVVVLSAVRLPIGRFGGTLRNTSAMELGGKTIAEAVKRSRVPVDQIGEVIMGHCRQAGNGPNPARTAEYLSGLPLTIPAQTLNKSCPSALRGLLLASQQIRLGDADVIVAGGMDSMSTMPHLLKGARFDGFRLGNITLQDDWYTVVGLAGMTAIQGADYIGKKYGITRAAQDEFALESHRKAVAAWNENRFADEVVSFEVRPQGRQPGAVLERDENPRADTSLDKLSKLSPAAPGVETITAGNSSGMGDSAAALVLASRAKARELGLQPLASLVSCGITGCEDPRDMFEGPPLAIAMALKRAGMSLGDLDLIEVNEAFAAQVLANERVAGWDRAKLNVNGGAIALGHPTGHTGARIVVTLIHALRRLKKELGVAAICGGDGIGVAAIVKIEG